MWRVKGKRMKQISLLLAIYLAFFQVASTVQAESGQAVQTNEVQDITSMAPAGPTTIQVGFDGALDFSFRISTTERLSSRLSMTLRFL